MSTLLKFATLLALLTSCVKPQPVAPSPTKACAIPALPPAPTLASAHACGDQVCISMDDSVALSAWIYDVADTRSALSGCPQVQLVTE